jgi:predicted nuclease of predicted toxin-antitoxin system
MKVLLDECLPRRLKRELPGHTVSTVPEMGWAGAKNGALLRLAETTFEVFVTIDQNVAYQQNLRSVVLAIVVLVAANNRLDTLRPLMPRAAAALHTVRPGGLVRITL